MKKVICIAILSIMAAVGLILAGCTQEDPTPTPEPTVPE